MQGDKYIDIIRPRMGDKRFNHSLCVAKEAARLAEKYGADTEKAYTSGILHDIMKETNDEIQLQIIEQSGIMFDKVSRVTKKLWHAKSGAAYIKDILKINDSEIINAVSYHTTGRAGMSLQEKMLFLADFTSSDRDYEEVDEMRKETEKSIEDGMLFAFKFSICDLAERDKLIHPDTVEAYNELVFKMIK